MNRYHTVITYHLMNSNKNVTNNNTAVTTAPKDLLTSQIIVLFLTLFISICSALAPVIITRLQVVFKNINLEKLLAAIDILQGFGGGILLAAGLLHLMMESDANIKVALASFHCSDSVHDYPWACLAMSVSLGAIFFVENVLTKIVTTIKTSSARKKAELNRASDVVHVNARISAAEVMIEESSTDSDNSSSDKEAKNLDEKVDTSKEVMEKEIDIRTKQMEEGYHGHCHELGINDIDPSSSKSMQLFVSVVLWISIALHSIFEGLGIGVLESVGTVWSLFSALAAHKMVEGFTLGMILNKGMHKAWMAIIFLLVFAITLPIGIGIGIGVSQAASNSVSLLLIQGVLLSLASGALLHVALFEILFHQPDGAIPRSIRYVLYAFGFAVQATITAFS